MNGYGERILVFNIKSMLVRRTGIIWEVDKNKIKSRTSQGEPLGVEPVVQKRWMRPGSRYSGGVLRSAAVKGSVFSEPATYFPKLLCLVAPKIAHSLCSPSKSMAIYSISFSRPSSFLHLKCRSALGSILRPPSLFYSHSLFDSTQYHGFLMTIHVPIMLTFLSQATPLCSNSYTQLRRQHLYLNI